MAASGVNSISVSLSFILGRKVMMVSEYLRLRPGSIVVLDPMPDDMVEILANGKLIGRGAVNVRGERISVEMKERVTAKEPNSPR